jgi:N utilization substance protein A
VGSCIGSRGIRITAISHDVNDEKIDLVLYKEDPFEFIAEALSPAKVMSVEIFEEERRGVVVVPDDQISLAIGKGWRNVKLASKLTRYYLDVKSVSEMQAEGFEIATDEDEEGSEADEAAPAADNGGEVEDAADVLDDDATDSAVEESDSAEEEPEEVEPEPEQAELEEPEEEAEPAVEAAPAEGNAANSKSE